MELKYNVSGADRKKLVQAICEITECESKYMGAPSFAYQVDYFTVDKQGTVSFDDRADSNDVEQLIEQLYELGFTAENAKPDEERLTISFPRSLFTDTILDNLRSILKVKGSLIHKALGAKDLTIFPTDDHVEFPWFGCDTEPEAIHAYIEFLSKLCEMARTQKRVNASEKTVDNEKYAFRCFLLRLGFIGEEHKATRKILLKNLSGSSAFKGGAKNAVSE